jgi:xanthine dehydrogenase accessory factor
LRIIVEKPDKSISHETVFSDTFIVIVTRDHALDKECLEAALQTKAAYIGMIGSKNKVKAVFGRLNEKGLHPETDQRVYAPIGLDIGGKNPGEIAISVIAEIMKISYQRTGGHSRDWKIEFLE